VVNGGITLPGVRVLIEERLIKVPGKKLVLTACPQIYLLIVDDNDVLLMINYLSQGGP
jgi:hypothetical protein